VQIRQITAAAVTAAITPPQQPHPFLAAVLSVVSVVVYALSVPTPADCRPPIDSVRVVEGPDDPGLFAALCPPEIPPVVGPPAEGVVVDDGRPDEPLCGVPFDPPPGPRPPPLDC